MPLTSSLGTSLSVLGRSMILGVPPMITAALALGENLVHVTFSENVHWTGVLDYGDMSDPTLFIVTPVAGTAGLDGNPVRPVSVIASNPDTADPQSLYLTLDRPMSPHPAQYMIAVTGFLGTQTFYGTFKQIVQPSIDLPTPTRDIANPQTLEAAASLPRYSPTSLGVFATDDAGDYAVDSGLVSYKKRIFRRLVTNPGGFAHLGDTYGVGIPAALKQLGKASTLQKLAAAAETQIAQEPETETVKVLAGMDALKPGLVRFTILATIRGGSRIKFAATFPTAA